MLSTTFIITQPKLVHGLHNVEQHETMHVVPYILSSRKTEVVQGLHNVEQHETR